ncbi:MAG: segregation/condensation protein A [Bacilli bacterium]|nr:segregation/condensation protein A [Bacilli bacterium]
MEYKVTIDNFEGPLDLLLHLIKQSDIDIVDISILEITKQYLAFIEAQEEMNLNVASEYLVMAATLLEMKSNMLLPRRQKEEQDGYEEDPREVLIERLIAYQRYKEMTPALKELEERRNTVYTKEPADLKQFSNQDVTYEGDVTLDDLMKAFQSFLKRKDLEKPLTTKVTKKELSVQKRSYEIKSLLRKKKKLEFHELFDSYKKAYVVVTFLSILDLAKKQELEIKQEANFSHIYLIAKDGDKDE